MSLKGKNRKVFSYNNCDKTNCTFQYKDFEKTKSYNINFSETKFIGTSLRAAHMKYCNFSSCTFEDTDLIGTNLRGSKFINAEFNNCVLVSTILEKTNFEGATFNNTYLVGNNYNKAKKFPIDSDGIIMLNSIPEQDAVNPELIHEIELLRNNDIIRRSHTLHGKNGKVNTLTLLILQKEFSDDEMLKLLPILPQLVTTQFYTISYLRYLLTKARTYAIL